MIYPIHAMQYYRSHTGLGFLGDRSLIEGEVGSSRICKRKSVLYLSFLPYSAGRTAIYGEEVVSWVTTRGERLTLWEYVT
jgi:hypothetical protein